LLFVVLVGSLFYWFQLRPAKIRHDCSWIRHYEEAKPASLGTSEKELWQNGTLKDCSEEPESIFIESFCESRNKRIINEAKPKPAEPEKEWYSKATKEEYQFCLHDNGL